MLENITTPTSASTQLVQFLVDTVGNPQLPLAVREAVLNGLMTKEEITYFAKRINVRAALMEALRENGGQVNMNAIAKACGVNAGLVARVLVAIRDQYPPVPVSDQPLKLLLPKEARAREILDDILADAGFVIEGKQINDVRQELEPIPVRFERGRDMLTFLKAGVAQYAFVGNDKTEEVLAEEKLAGRVPLGLDMLGQFRLNSFRLCLAVPERIAEPARNFTPNVLRGSVVATSYPALTRQYLDNIGAKNVTVKTLSGNVEAAPRDLGAKAITDIVQTGGSLERNGLVEISTLLTCAMELFSLREAEIAPAARTQMGAFVQRLRVPDQKLAAA